MKNHLSFYLVLVPLLTFTLLYSQPADPPYLFSGNTGPGWQAVFGEGVSGHVFALTEPYSASKGGIVALSHALAVSLGPQIRVNCISPGWIETGEWKKSGKRATPKLRAEDHAQHPAGRVGKPEDVASLVAYLASSEAGVVTGQNFVVDGGMTKKMIYIE